MTLHNEQLAKISQLTSEDFVRCRGEMAFIYTGETFGISARIEEILTSAKISQGSRQHFIVNLSTDATEYLDQATYEIEIPSLGRLPLFITHRLPSEAGTANYSIIFC